MLAIPDRALHWDVLQVHLEDAGFLWTQRAETLASSRYTLPEVEAGPETRLRAHLAALATAGRQCSERLLIPSLEGEDPELKTAAALALLLEGEGRDADRVLKAFAQADAGLRDPVTRALEVSDGPGVTEGLAAALSSQAPPEVVSAALDALTFRRTPVEPTVLDQFLGVANRLILSAAVRALRLAPGLAYPELTAFALADADEELRLAGLVSGLILGQQQAFHACQTLAPVQGEDGRLSALVLGFSGSHAGLELLLGLLERPERRGDVLWALGFSGRPPAADACVRWMADPEVGGLAAEAFSAITGLAIAGQYLRAPPPVPDGPDELDDTPAPAGEELPLADMERASGWWSEARRGLDPNGRYLYGKPWGLPAMREHLAKGPTRRRPAMALELAIRTRGAVQVETFAYGKVQRLQEAAASGFHPGRSFMQPFDHWG